MNNKCVDEETKTFNYRVKGIFKNDTLIMNEISDDMVEYLDISYNYINYIIPLINNFI